MPNTSLACEECHRRKQKCDRQIPCQNCLDRGLGGSCRAHEKQSKGKDIMERLTAVERELERFRALLKQVQRQYPLDGSKGVIEQLDSEETSQGSAGRSTPLPEGLLLADSIGETIEKSQVGSVLDKLQHKSSSDKEQLPQWSEPPLFHVDQAPDLALQLHGIPSTCLSDLLASLPSQRECDALVAHFYNDLNWIRQPWPRNSLCQSFARFWDTGPELTSRNLNTFALLCSLCAISRLSIQHRAFDGNERDRKLEARRLHYTARHSLMLSSVFNREDLDQIIAWTLACRFLVLERRYGEAYTCAARTVKAAYSIQLHRDGSKQGKSKEVTEIRRRVWSAVYYFDKTISMLTGRPPVIDDRYCDVWPPSESGGMEDIYPLSWSSEPQQIALGEASPTVYAYCVHRHKVAILQGRMITTFLTVKGDSTRKSSRDKELASINEDLQAIQASLPSYLRVTSYQVNETSMGIKYNHSYDESHGYLPIQRFLLQSEITALSIGLHRPYLLSKRSKDGNSLYACMNAALLHISLYKDFTQRHGDSSQLEVQVYVGSYRWFHSVLLCGIILLAQPDLKGWKVLLQNLQDFVNKEERWRDPSIEQESSSVREIEVINLFIQGYNRRQDADRRSGSKRKSNNGDQASQNSGRLNDEYKRPKISKSRHRQVQSGEGCSDSHSQAMSSPLTSNVDASSTGSVDAQDLLDSWFAKDVDPHTLSASNSKENLYADDFSSVFGETGNLESGIFDFLGTLPKERDSHDVPSNHIPQSTQQVPSEQNNHEVGSSHLSTDHKVAALENNPKFDQSINGNLDAVDEDFWLNFIGKL